MWCAVFTVLAVFFCLASIACPRFNVSCAFLFGVLVFRSIRLFFGTPTYALGSSRPENGVRCLPFLLFFVFVRECPLHLVSTFHARFCHIKVHRRLMSTRMRCAVFFRSCCSFLVFVSVQCTSFQRFMRVFVRCACVPAVPSVFAGTAS